MRDEQIHKAFIQHSGVAERNMAVDGDLERAAWVDFDRVQTFEKLRQQYKRWIEFEFELVFELVEALLFLNED